MKIRVLTICFALAAVLAACTSTEKTANGTPDAGKKAPGWVQNLQGTYPPGEWVAVVGQGTSQNEAESAAMNALARAFKTDVASLTQASEQMSQIVTEAQGKKSVSFNQNQDFTQNVNTSSNVRGLIGVQVDVYNAPANTVYVNARMNRRECAASYSLTIQENVAIISRLLAAAAAMPGTLEAYANLSFAHSLAQVTDNYQNILEVLDPPAAKHRPAYGGANAVKTKMLECASLITIGIVIDTPQAAERTLLARAAGSFFRDWGFKINEQGRGNYVLRANARFEELRQQVISCRYYLDAVIENQNSAALFSFTEDDRKAHIDNSSEARRLAVRAVETSLKEGKFAGEFSKWLNSLLE